MLLGYNTNGLAHHDVFEGVALLAEIGYKSVAITLDHAALNPFAGDLRPQVDAMRRLLDERALRSVVETGARFLLDPRHKHEPTLVTAEAASRRRRIDFLHRALDIASTLGSDCVSFWSGRLRDDADEDAAFARLVEALRPVVDHAASLGMRLGFEPEPGMFIDTMDRYDRLRERIDAPHFGLTLDIGHLHCQGETPLAAHIARHAPRLLNVHIEDMRAGVHEHLMFGEGEIDFREVVGALARAGYAGGLHVELSRHSHMAPEAAGRAFGFLRPLVEAAKPGGG
ncbi:MAG TPA: sugar phosphate isomerase/epimerase family protein [Pirellulales bacterium]|nr:sugar phosphate isomerase/epimerase family protein [Pirellulales bacterium]